MTAEERDRELEVLRHSLGLNRSKRAYRNHFAATPGSEDFKTCCALVERGLMVTTRLEETDSPCRMFAVTPAGEAAVRAAGEEGRK